EDGIRYRNVTGVQTCALPIYGNNSPIVNVSDKVHLVVDISNTKPYLNEGITVLYKLYVKEGTSVSNWRTTDMPRYPNFWSHNIRSEERRVGKEWRIREVKRY